MDPWTERRDTVPDITPQAESVLDAVTAWVEEDDHDLLAEAKDAMSYLISDLRAIKPTQAVEVGDNRSLKQVAEALHSALQCAETVENEADLDLNLGEAWANAQLLRKRLQDE